MILHVFVSHLLLVVSLNTWRDGAKWRVHAIRRVGMRLGEPGVVWHGPRLRIRVTAPGDRGHCTAHAHGGESGAHPVTRGDSRKLSPSPSTGTKNIILNKKTNG